MYQTIRYEKNGNIGIATINRPEALNALNSTVISELEQLISEVEKDAELGAFIITGEGRSFVAGADIGEQSTMDVAAGRKWGQRGSALFRRIEKLEIPTIAAVNGFALGGGCELAMSCDIRVASATSFWPPAPTLRARAAPSSASPRWAWASPPASPAPSVCPAVWAWPRPRS